VKSRCKIISQSDSTRRNNPHRDLTVLKNNNTNYEMSNQNCLD